MKTFTAFLSAVMSMFCIFLIFASIHLKEPFYVTVLFFIMAVNFFLLFDNLITNKK